MLLGLGRSNFYKVEMVQFCNYLYHFITLLTKIIHTIRSSPSLLASRHPRALVSSADVLQCRRAAVVPHPTDRSQALARDQRKYLGRDPRRSAGVRPYAPAGELLANKKVVRVLEKLSGEVEHATNETGEVMRVRGEGEGVTLSLADMSPVKRIGWGVVALGTIGEVLAGCVHRLVVHGGVAWVVAPKQHDGMYILGRYSYRESARPPMVKTLCDTVLSRRL